MNLSPLPVQKFFSNIGLPLVGGKLFTYEAGTSTKQATYQNSSGTLNTNPIILNFRGEANIWLDPSLTYKFVLAGPFDSDPPTNPIWSVDNISAPLNVTDVTQQFIGRILWPRSTAEIAASVTPVNYAYIWGDLRRYGAVLDGVTDDRTAITSAYAQFVQDGGANLILPAGTSYVSKNGSNVYALLFNDDVILDGGGAFALKGDGTNDYTLIYATGGTDVTIDVRGVRFDCAKASPDRPSDNNDICFRIQSSVDTVNIEDCDFENYNEDGIYFRADVTGAGGAIHRNRFKHGARSAVTLVKGQYVSIDHNEADDIQLVPFTVQAVDINTVCRQISVDYNRIIGGGYDQNANTDRAAIFIAHVTGATSANMGQYTCRGNVIKDFGATWTPGAGLYAFGIEVRECTDTLIQGNEVTGCTKGAGLFSYLSIRAAFIGNLCSGNDKGWWVNKCTDCSEIGNFCLGNVTYNYDYHGPDGATTFLQADGLSMLLGRGSVAYTAGTPAFIAGDLFNFTSITDLGVGDAQLNFTRDASNANYTINATFRSHSGTSGLIQSASKATNHFRIVTLSAGVASDENFDVEVRGTGPLVNLPP